MRLTVLIPAHNEEASLQDVIHRVPRRLPGIGAVTVAVVDDGSTDRTADVARASGAVLLKHGRRLGLAAAFRTGLSHALAEGADLIATLDADGQYRPEELALLSETLQRTHADLVVGDRQIRNLTHMPLSHRIGNTLGSFMLRILGTTGIRDASSGFRMFTRSFGLLLRITSEHTYTHEMLIQASAVSARTAEVPVTFLARKHGRSKLVRTLRHHILRSCGTILRAIFLYRPLRKFLPLAALCALIALGLLIPALRSEFRFTMLVAPAIFLMLAVQFVVLGLIADAQASERRLRSGDFTLRS